MIFFIFTSQPSNITKCKKLKQYNNENSLGIYIILVYIESTVSAIIVSNNCNRKERHLQSRCQSSAVNSCETNP